MREIKLRLDESEISFLDKIAQENNTTRSDIIRRNLRNRLTPSAVRTVTNAIRQRVTAPLTQHQAEHVAAVAISSLLSATP
jgi:ribosomal protein S20